MACRTSSIAFSLCLAALVGFPALSAAAKPANDDFADARGLAAELPVEVSGSNRDATAQGNEPRHWDPSRRASVWYEWAPERSQPVVVRVAGLKGFDPVLAIYTGEKLGGLELLANDDDSGGELAAQIQFYAEAETTYRLAVDGYVEVGEDDDEALGQGNFELTIVYDRDAPDPNRRPPSSCMGEPATIFAIVGEPTVGTPGDDVIVGTNTHDVIGGQGGDDLICGLHGDDVIRGGSGDDQVRGGAGGDLIVGRAENDLLRGGRGDDKLRGGQGNDTLKGSIGDDRLRGRNGNDLIFGGGDDDVLFGGPGEVDNCFGGRGRNRYRESCETALDRPEAGSPYAE